MGDASCPKPAYNCGGFEESFMRLALALTLLILSGSRWSCAERLTGPAEPALDVRLELRLSPSSGDPAHPVVATATVTNHRLGTIYHSGPCVGTVTRFTVLDRAGTPVWLVDPTAALPGCADYCCAPLDPGAKLVEQLRFSGTLFTETGDAYPAPAGDYTVVASFHGSGKPMESSPIDRTRSAAFHWAEP